MLLGGRMGENPDVTREQVMALADKLVAAGAEPALRAIRDRLGAGTTDTILEFLQEWRRAQEARALGDLAVSRATESRLRGELAHQTELASEHCSAMVPLTAERDAIVADLAKAVLRLEYIPCLEAAIEALRADRDREHAGRTQAEQEAACLATRIQDLQAQLDEARAKARAMEHRGDGGTAARVRHHPPRVHKDH